MCVCVCVCQRERKREREREKKFVILAELMLNPISVFCAVREFHMKSSPDLQGTTGAHIKFALSLSIKDAWF